jgi:hypothetical protein
MNEFFSRAEFTHKSKKNACLFKINFSFLMLRHSMVQSTLWAQDFCMPFQLNLKLL